MRGLPRRFDQPVTDSHGLGGGLGGCEAAKHPRPRVRQAALQQAALRRPGLHTRAIDTLVVPRKHQLLRNPRGSLPGDDITTSAGRTQAGYSRAHAVRKSPSAVFHAGGGRR